AGDLEIRNTGEMAHNLVAVDGKFRTADLATGKSETLRLATGIHRVYCTIHGSRSGTGMAGVIVVGDAQTIAATSPAPDSEESGSAGMARLVLLLTTAVAGAVTVAAVTVFRRRGRVLPAS
ncbi:MAG: cupredoxin domain-containing protein, partial [Acidimicrobiales bacterium]